jgi:hypothetical protein
LPLGCTGGDPGYNEYHEEFFAEWFSRFLEGGLPAALEWAYQQKKFSDGDFLHLFKLFCNRVKKHTVTRSPECLSSVSLSADTLETILKFGAALSDCSSIRKMRDSYALQLCSLSFSLTLGDTGIKGNVSLEASYGIIESSQFGSSSQGRISRRIYDSRQSQVTFRLRESSDLRPSWFGASLPITETWDCRDSKQYSMNDEESLSTVYSMSALLRFTGISRKWSFFGFK